MVRMDFSGVARFWEVADNLAAGREPPYALWAALFSTCGYRALTVSEFEPGFFKELWRLSYTPVRRDDLHVGLTPGKIRRLEHYREVLRKRAELEMYQMVLQGNASVADEAQQLAREFLPETKHSMDFTVAFLVFGPDARGYEPVVVDLLYAFNIRDRLALMLAHELHHVHICRLRGINTGVPDRRTDLAWIVDQIHMEGMADMILHDGGARDSGTGQEESIEESDHAIRYLRYFSEQLGRACGDRSALAGIEAQLRRDLRDSGHTVGLYMAQVVTSQLGRECLISQATDPPGFFSSYREACLARGHECPLSEMAADFVRDYYSTAC